MKLSIFFLTAAATTRIASAWHLQLYSDAEYKNIIVDRSGTLGQPCKNLNVRVDNSASSMKWNADGLAWSECEIVLYNWANCEEGGGILGFVQGGGGQGIVTAGDDSVSLVFDAP